MNQLPIFQALTNGDKVCHKLTGQILSIKSVSETVASCWLPDPVKTKFDTEVRICVCSINNLEKI